VDVTLNEEILVADIGNLVFMPAQDANGAGYDSFDFKVHDGTEYSVAANTITVDVTPVQDAPTAADKTVTTNEDTAYTFAAADFGFADVDAGDTLTKIQITSLESVGTLKLSGADVTLNQEILVADIGNLVFTPVPDANGTGYDSFDFKVHDGTEYSVAANTITVDVTPVQDAPTAADKTVTTNEDTAYTFSAADFGFSDVDAGDSLTKIQITSLESNGTLKLSGADVTLNQEILVADIGNLVFLPAQDANGIGYDSFDFKVHDGTEYSAAANTITVDVTPVQDAPTAADKTVTTNEDTTYTFTAADFGFSDVDAGDVLTKIQITSLESNGSLQLNGVDVTLNQEIAKPDIDFGLLVFVPAPDANGTGYDSFDFKVHDGTEYSVAANTITVDVTPVQDAPTAADKTVTTNEDTAYTFNATDFGFSDVDAGDSLTKIQITSLESVGTLKLSGADVTLNQEILVADIGNLVFTPVVPDANGTGYDSFDFKVHDGTEYSVAANTITVDVTPVQDAPTAADKTVTTNEDTAYTLTAADFGFSDVDVGDVLTKIQITSLESNGSLQLNGVDVTLNQEIAKPDIDFGLLVFVPAPDANGTGYDSFDFKVHDGTEYSVAANTITVDVTPVQDAPTAADKTVTTNEDTAYTFSAADFGFSDVDAGDTLTKIQITSLESNGTLKLSGADVALNQEILVADIGNLVFMPAQDANGAGYDSFDFKVHDGIEYSVAANTITVDVMPVQDAPTAADKTVTTNEDTAYTFSAADFGFSDVDAGDSLTKIQITSLESNGTLKLSGADVTLNQEILVADIGNLVFLPAQDANGTGYDSFDFKVHDGTEYSVAANTITVDVTPVQDAPTAADKTVTTNEDTAYTFSAADFGFSDVDAGDVLTKIQITSLESNGTLKLNGVDVTLNQEIAKPDIDFGFLVFTPAQDANGTGYDSFDFKVHDGTEYSVAANTITVDVTPVQDAPTAADKTVTTNEDTAYTFSAADFGFSDVDAGDSLTKIQITSLESNGTLKLSGVDVTLNQEILVADIGNLVFLPAQDTNGAGYDSFDFKVHDGTEYSVAANTITVDVTPVQDAPTAADKTVTTNEDTAYTFTAADFGFSDVDAGEVLTKIQITSLESNGTLKLNGVDVTLNQEIAKPDIDFGFLVFTPAQDANGTGYDSFDFKVHDGTEYSVAANTITVDVTPVQDAPTAADKTVTTNEDTAYTFAAADFGFSDVDAGDSLTKIQITSLESNGTLKLSGADVTLNQEILVADIGNLVFMPAQDANGTGYDSFDFKVHDGTEYSVAANTITVDVTPVQDAPTAADKTVTTNEDTAYTFSAADFGFSDVDAGDSLTKIQITGLESNGTLKLSGADVTLNQEILAADIGNLVFMPAQDANGAGYDSFDFKVHDGTEYSVAARCADGRRQHGDHQRGHGLHLLGCGLRVLGRGRWRHPDEDPDHQPRVQWHAEAEWCRRNAEPGDPGG
jgi:hypothetical protein